MNLVHSGEHLESPLAAQDAGVASLQEFLVQRGEGARPRPNGHGVH